MKKLILTRHGETEENVAGIIQGHLSGHLSERGIEQAQKVARRLKNEPLEVIYSSDLDRAANTAKAIAKYHPDIPLQLTTSLREKYLGSWQGKTKKELGFESHASVAEIFYNEGESTRELYLRAERFIREIQAKHSNSETVLLVGHNGINKALIAVLTGKNEDDIPTIGHQDNTCITSFEVNEQGCFEIVEFNCVEHL